MQSKKSAYELAIIPGLLAVASYFFIDILFPLYSAMPGYDQDPAYAYLFNGLLLAQGQPPFHIDHPGTPLQLIFAIVILIQGHLSIAISQTHTNLIEIVLSQPEAYLYTTSWILVALNCFALYFFGNRIYQSSKNLPAALFSQCGIFGFSLLTPKVGYPAPESLLIFVSLLLLGLLAPYIFRDSQSVDTEKVLCNTKALGFVYGLGVATKLTFVPMLGLLYLFKPRRKLLAISLWFIGSFLVLTLPVLPNLARFLQWVTNISTHSGVYGSGDATFINAAEIPNRIHDLVSWYPVLYAILFLLIIKIFFSIVSPQMGKKVTIDSSNTDNSPAWVFIIICIFQSMLVLKHPGAHYMIPTLLIPFLAMSWLATSVNKSLNLKTRYHAYSQYSYWLLALFLAFCAVAPSVKGYYRLAQQRQSTDLALSNIEKFLSQHPDAVVICGFRCSLPKYAQALGMEYAPWLISDITLPYVRNFYEYNIFIHKLVAHGKPIYDAKHVDDLLAERKDIFLVTPVIYPDLKIFKLEKLIDNPMQSLYQVVGTYQ